jgi:hypothetical protein
MAMRRQPYDFTTAATELGLAIALFGCGLFDAPIWLTGLAAAAMLAYSGWSRRLVLNRLRGASWAMATAFATLAIIAIVAGAYWLGLEVGRMI